MQNSLFKLLFLTLFYIPLSADDLHLDTIVQSAKKSSKPVLLFFHKPRCGYCDHMMEFTLKDPEVVKLIDSEFIFVDIYTKESGDLHFKDFHGSRRAFAKSLGYDFYPTTMFIDSSNEVIHISPGYQEQDDYLKVLQYITSKKYLKMELQTYLDMLEFDSDS